MSEHDTPRNGVADDAPDPVDRAYVQAEALLGEEDARAARRARVLAAVAREPGAPPVARPRSAWRQGGARWAGWLAAASIVGLGVVMLPETHQPARRLPPPIAPAAAPRTPSAAASLPPV